MAPPESKTHQAAFRSPLTETYGLTLYWGDVVNNSWHPRIVSATGGSDSRFSPTY